MSTHLKNILRFTALTALLTIFCLIGVKIIKNDDWLNIKRPIAGNDNNNFDRNLTLNDNTNGSSAGNSTAADGNSSDDSALNNGSSANNNGCNNDSSNNNDSSSNDNSGSDSATQPSSPDAAQNPTDNGTIQNPADNNTQESSAINNSQPSKPSDSSGSSEFTKALPEYFDDALFIGDSRTVGLKEYGSIKNATFFASIGMDIYNIYSIKINVGKQGKIDLTSLLKNNKYSKVYIMLGINELDYNFNSTIKKYSELIDTIRSCQPGVIIYVEANMHVSESRSASDNIFNNANINKFNNMLASLADAKNAYYLDVNPLFDDAKGNLRADYTHDNTHVLGKHYKTWTDWIAENAVAKPD